MTTSLVFKAVVVLGLSNVVAACETVTPASQTTVMSVAAPVAPVELRLAAGDKLRVIVFGE